MKKFYVTICLVLISESVALCQSQPEPRPLHMLVLGDSIMWGQGLKREHKSWYLVKLWLERSTGRRVVERVEAHSGAVIERSSVTEYLRADNPEVGVYLPTIHEELDSAMKAYPDRSMIDLVLLSGCANDVGSQNLLNAATTLEIDEMTEVRCGGPVVQLLRRILSSFPAAQVIVTGYYPFFSEKTENDFVLRGLAKRLIKVIPGTPRLSSSEIFKRLKLNSHQWYLASNKSLAGAVRIANVEAGSPRPRVMFASLEFDPNYSFAAPKTHLWNFDRSPFRMALLLLSFGKILLPTNDEVRKQRIKSCNELFKNMNVERKETSEEKKTRKQRLSLCQYAALGHPNRKGAVLYANAIIKLLQDVR